MANIRYRVIQVNPDACAPAPYSSGFSFPDNLEQMLVSEMRARGDLLFPAWGVEARGSCQVFLGAYQIQAFKAAFPNQEMPVRIGMDTTFAPQEIVAIMLNPKNEGNESSHLARAMMIRKLKKWNNFSDQAIADASSMNRVTVAHLKKLLTLHSEVKNLLQAGKISYSIARELIPVPKEEQLKLARRIVRVGMDLPAVRAFLGKAGSKKRSPTAARALPKEKSSDIKRLEEQMSQTINHQVSVDTQGSGAGSITISGFDKASLEGLLEQMSSKTLKGGASLVLKYEDLDAFDEISSSLLPSEF